MTKPKSLSILGEDRMTLKQAATRLRCNYKTVLSYASRGFARIRNGKKVPVVLETLRIGGKVDTSAQAIERFLTEINK